MDAGAPPARRSLNRVYRFLLRPAWILSHVLVLLLVVVLLNLGLWQLRRLDERRDANALIEERALTESVVPLSEVPVEAADPVTVGDEVVWQRVQASGRYQIDDQVLLRSRSLDGQPGFWVLTPLELDGGGVLVVNRGWIPFEVETDGSDVEFATPTSAVEVVGFLQESVEGAKPAGGRTTTIAHVDLEWFDEQVDGDVHPVYLQLQEQQPPPVDDLPVILPEPDLSEGPHLGYALQWFTFTAIAVVGYPIVLYRVAQGRGSDGSNRPPEYDDELPVSEPAAPA